MICLTVTAYHPGIRGDENRFIRGANAKKLVRCAMLLKAHRYRS